MLHLDSKNRSEPPGREQLPSITNRHQTKGFTVGNRERLLIQLDKAWRAFRDSYAGLTDAELSQPGVVKTWSVRHIIAHVTSWEEEALKHLPVVLAGRRPPRYSVVYGGIDAFNAQTMKRKGKLTLSEILREQTSVHETLIQLIENTPEHELAGDTRFRRRLRLDTYGHYPKHANAIRQWRARMS
jgi:hypothetical protein